MSREPPHGGAQDAPPPLKANPAQARSLRRSLRPAGFFRGPHVTASYGQVTMQMLLRSFTFRRLVPRASPLTIRPNRSPLRGRQEESGATLK